MNIKTKIVVKLISKNILKEEYVYEKLQILTDIYLLIYLYLVKFLLYHIILLYLALIRPKFCNLELDLSKIKIK